MKSNSQQLIFFFMFPPEDFARHADKNMVAKELKYGPVMVHRQIRFGVWVVSCVRPIHGPSGYVAASTSYVFPQLFFKGREAWTFANKVSNSSIPCLHDGME